MNPAVMTWLAFRLARWLLWIGFLGCGLHYLMYPESHLDQFGHLNLRTEIAMFGLGIAAVFAGFLELMMRERAGLQRPEFGRLIPARETGASR